MVSLHPYNLILLRLAMESSATWVTPMIAGVLIVGVVIAILQGGLQLEDNTLAMTAKLIVFVLLAAGSGVAAIHGAAHLARDWISHIPQMIDHRWS